MSRLLPLLAVLGLTLSAPVVATASDCVELPTCTLANEYIRALGEIQTIIDQSQAEQRAAKSNPEQLSNAIHMSRLMVTTLRSDVSMLKTLHADPETVKILTSLYSNQISLYQRLMDISTAFMSGPKPGVDYGALAAELPQVRADLDSVGKMYMQMSNLIFGQLIDMTKTDEKNHVNRLVINQAERKDLIDHINRAFGKKLEGKDQSYACSGAWVLRANLLKDFKASDG